MKAKKNSENTQKINQIDDDEYFWAIVYVFFSLLFYSFFNGYYHVTD
jgi:hypothetical protein